MLSDWVDVIFLLAYVCREKVHSLWPVLHIILTITQNWTDTWTESDREIQTNIFFLPLWLAPSVSQVLVKLHIIFNTAGLTVCVSRCVGVSCYILMLCFYSMPKIQTQHQDSTQTEQANCSWAMLTCVFTLLTSRLMILSVVRCTREVSECMCVCSMCEKLCKQEADRQSWPSPPYSWTSRDRHWRASSHTSWFSVDSYKERSSINACNG